MIDVLRETVPLAALAGLLVVAYVHPPGWVEALVGLVAAGATLATWGAALGGRPRRTRAPVTGGHLPGRDLDGGGELSGRGALRGGRPAPLRRTTTAGVCLGLVVAALGQTWLGDLLRDVVPAGDGLGALLLLALLGAVLSNVVNNLPATLLLVPLVAPLGTTAVLATLVGINVGSSLTWTGSLANLLWRRTLLRAGVRPSSRDFHLVGLIASPVGIVLGVLVLAGWTSLIT